MSSPQNRYGLLLAFFLTNLFRDISNILPIVPASSPIGCIHSDDTLGATIPSNWKPLIFDEQDRSSCFSLLMLTVSLQGQL